MNSRAKQVVSFVLTTPPWYNDSLKFLYRQATLALYSPNVQTAKLIDPINHSITLMEQQQETSIDEEMFIP